MKLLALLLCAFILLLVGLSKADVYRIFPLNQATPGALPTSIFQNNECNTAGTGQSWAPTTATTISGNTVITVGNAAGFKKLGGILVKHAGLPGLTGTPATPAVTAVQLVTGETHTVSPNTGVANFNTTSNFVADYALRINQSSTSLWRINNTLPASTPVPGISQYAAPLSNPAAVGNYLVSTVNMTTPIGVLNDIYWKPDTTDGTTLCYAIRFIGAADDTDKASAGNCTTTAAAILGMGLNNTTGLPTKGVAINWGTPPAGAIGVAIYRSTDSGVTYAPYWAQPVADTTTLFAGVQDNIWVDEGRAIGPYFQPYDNTAPGPIVDNNIPPFDTNTYNQDLLTTITSVAGTTLTLAVAPSVTFAGGATLAETDDTQALHDARITCGNQGGGFIDIPNGCRFNYQNGNNYPDLYSTNPSNGCTLRGTKNYLSGGATNLTITGTGNGACSFFDNTKGGLEIYPFMNIQNIEFGCNDNGSTNFLLGCLLSNGSSLPNGSSRILRSGNGNQVSALQLNKGNCPNAVGMVLTGSANRIEEPYFVRMKRVAWEGGNGTVVTGPGDIGFPYQLKYPVWEHVGGQPFTFSGVVEEIGPNFFMHDGTPVGGPCTIANNYWADAPDTNQNNFCTGAATPSPCCTGNGTGTCGFDLGDDLPAAFGTHGNAFGDPGCDIRANLVEGGSNNEMVLMSAGSVVEANNFYALAGTINNMLIQDGTQGNFSNNKIATNFIGGTGAGGGSTIVDDATLGHNTFDVQFYHNNTVLMTQHSIDLTNAKDSGEIWYNQSVDSLAVGSANTYTTSDGIQTSILDPNGTIPKWHHLHAFNNNTDSSSAEMNLTIGSGRFDKGTTCAEAAGAGCLIAFKKGNTPKITIADTTAFSVNCTGTPLVVDQQGHMEITTAAGVTPGLITAGSCIAPDSSFPAVGHPAAGTTVQCVWTVTGANQVTVGPCSADVAVKATPTPTPTPVATQTPTPSPTPIATPTPFGNMPG